MKVVHATTAVVAGVIVSILSSSSVKALTLFEDNFNSETAGFGRTTLTNWNITAGNVDVYSPYGGQGNSLDMDGTPSANATIETKQLFQLAAGTYQLSFKIGNNTFSGNNLLVQLGSIFSETVSATPALTPITRSFTVTTPTSARLSFAEKGPVDRGGSVLDDVKLDFTPAATVPTPALLPGFIGLSIGLLRKRKQEKVENVEG